MAGLSKRPNEEFTFGIDFTDKLSTNETISSITSVKAYQGTESGTEVTSSLVVSSAIHSNNLQINIRLRGGTGGLDYIIIAKFVTSENNTLEERVKLVVRL